MEEDEKKTMSKRKAVKRSVNLASLFDCSNDICPMLDPEIAASLKELFEPRTLTDEEKREVALDIHAFLNDIGITGKTNGVIYIHQILENAALSSDVNLAISDTIWEFAQARNISEDTVDSSITQAIHKGLQKKNMCENVRQIYGVSVNFCNFGARGFLRLCANTYITGFLRCKTTYMALKKERDLAALEVMRQVKAELEEKARQKRQAEQVIQYIDTNKTTKED